MINTGGWSPYADTMAGGAHIAALYVCRTFTGSDTIVVTGGAGAIDLVVIH